MGEEEKRAVGQVKEAILRRQIMKLFSIFSAVGVLVGLFAYLIAVFDPFRWGLVQSEKFSWVGFEKIEKGDQIDRVIERLGEPVRPAEDLSSLAEDRHDPCAAGGCKKYVFAGAVWGASFKEAIVIVDSRGYVLYAITRQE